MTDIYAKGLSEPTFRAIETLCLDREWPEFSAWMEHALFTGLIERMKRVPDNENYFPKGKWATIQRMQQMAEEWYVNDEKCWQEDHAEKANS